MAVEPGIQPKAMAACTITSQAFFWLKQRCYQQSKKTKEMDKLLKNSDIPINFV
ncbi:MAG: hypothetical protein IPM52_01515 [Bacteroidetes bacterium]|nr:hypothetical protein [Bacteroidota bacterium]